MSHSIPSAATVADDLLHVEHLSRHYRNGGSIVTALDDVTFSVPKGQFVAIVGPSGSGKSTLMHLLGGVDRPTSGTVRLDGTDLYTMDETRLAVFRRRQIGLVFQFFNLIPVLDVSENILLPLLLDGREPEPDLLDGILGMLHLTDRARHLPNQLSGGQQQRVSIGRALSTRPALMLADEPTGNLDSRNSAELIDLLRQANRQYRQTLILITHDHGIARQADRVLSMEDGRVVGDELLRKEASVGGAQR